MTRRASTAALVVLASAALVACGSDSKSKSSSSTPKPTEQKLKTPKIAVKFKSPKAGAKTGKKVSATVTLTNFKVDAKQVGKAPKPGRGHIHFSMDGGKFDFPKYSGANGKLAKKLGVEGKYSPAVAPKITYSGLPKGKHTLKVDLANNDHSNAGATASTTFTVK